MTAQEIVNRLERVMKTRDGWTARCPAHEDDRPSLSIGTGEDGRVLLRCFAGCQLEAILAALRLEVSDLFPPAADAPAARLRGAPVPAREIGGAARWLKSARALPDAEIARMHAAETRGGPAVVFRYVDQSGRVLYDKFRPIGDRKVFWRVPRGQPSALYGLADLPKDGGPRAIVVEGELDLHALRAAGVGPVVSVPDGAGSRLSVDLLRPLAGFRQVLIATDADGPGDELAARLGHELGPARCRRMRLVDGLNTLKDANDALRAGWTRERFEAALRAATPATPRRTAPTRPDEVNANETVLLDGAGDESSPYRLLDGQLCRMRHDRDGNETTQVLANFDARIFEEVAYDDGAEVVRAFKIRGRLANGTPLSDARVTASEFGGLNWVPSAWGARALVTAGQGAKDHLRAAIQVLSDPVSRLVFRHTGWREHGGRWVYLYQGGGVGAEDITVELDPPLDRFVLPPSTVDLREAVGWSMRILDAAPPSVSIPLLAATYAAPLSFIINPD
ncbi:MAG TPA: toprim domain-containing protein, partial [Polyangia bacterium]|nr:toprim domain-containing protein [Polyangia bacterium]